MPTFGSLQARVVVDGVKLPEFDVRETFHDEDLKTIECWVESQPGQVRYPYLASSSSSVIPALAK
jgi:hypothetical protein